MLRNLLLDIQITMGQLRMRTIKYVRNRKYMQRRVQKIQWSALHKENHSYI